MLTSAIEFFAGVGGFACAAGGRWQSLAIDIDQQAKRVYQCNFPGQYVTRELESLPAQELQTLEGDLWWLSPPCQPYSRRGKQLDTSDPRTGSLLHLIELLKHVRPRAIALENVPGFAHSSAGRLLRTALDSAGYYVSERLLCPTQLGWPNRRLRFYLLADLHKPRDWQPLPVMNRTLAEVLASVELNEGQLNELWLDIQLVDKYRSAMDRVCIEVPTAVTACFGSSYGKSLLHAGSYVETSNGLRYFHPREVARLLGFPPTFRWPADLSNRQLWKLFGNSLAIPAVEYVISHLR